MSWKLISSDGEELIITSFDPIDRVSTILFNVTVERHEGNEIVSLITFQDVENYNGTQVQCTFAASPTVFSNSPIATLRVFGKFILELSNLTDVINFQAIHFHSLASMLDFKRIVALFFSGLPSLLPMCQISPMKC